VGKPTLKFEVGRNRAEELEEVEENTRWGRKKWQNLRGNTLDGGVIC